MLCAGLFAFHCVLFCASAHCNVNCHKCFQFLQQICWRCLLFHLLKELLCALRATWLWFILILCKASWQKCQLLTCIWFACSSHEARKHVNFSLFGKFWHTQGLHLHLGCVASLSNLSGTAHAIGFPQHVDTTAASHKSQNCEHALAASMHLLMSWQNTLQSTHAKTINGLIQYMQVSSLSYAAKPKVRIAWLRALRGNKRLGNNWGLLLPQSNKEASENSRLKVRRKVLVSSTSLLWIAVSLNLAPGLQALGLRTLGSPPTCASLTLATVRLWESKVAKVMGASDYFAEIQSLTSRASWSSLAKTAQGSTLTCLWMALAWNMRQSHQSRHNRSITFFAGLAICTWTKKTGPTMLLLLLRLRF